MLAIADSYALVIRKQGEEVDAEAAIASLHEQVGSQFDPDCYGALTTAADGGRSPLAVSRFAPDERARELTPRELGGCPGVPAMTAVRRRMMSSAGFPPARRFPTRWAKRKRCSR